MAIRLNEPSTSSCTSSPTWSAGSTPAGTVTESSVLAPTSSRSTPSAKPAKRPLSSSRVSLGQRPGLGDGGLAAGQAQARRDDRARSGRGCARRGARTSCPPAETTSERSARASTVKRALAAPGAAAALDAPHAVGAVAELVRLGAQLRAGLEGRRRAGRAGPRRRRREPAVTTMPRCASRATTTPSTVSAEAAAGNAASRARAAITVRFMPLLSARNRYTFRP